MKISQNKFKVVFLLFVLVSTLSTCLLYLSFISSHKNDDVYRSCDKKLAVLVPFRDRFNELVTFVPHISRFLTNQKRCYKLFLLNQVDHYRFNRAALINAGFLLTKNDFDYIAIHDIDLLPLNRNLSYHYPANGPYHLSAPHLHPKYHYEKFVGGILLINKEHFIQVNGMSNRYWGWGMEDDEFYVRLKDAHFVIERPIRIGTNITNSFKHIHDSVNYKRDTKRCFNQKEMNRRRDRQTGLSNLSYRLESSYQLVIDSFSIDVFNIFLNCNKSITPWCYCEGSK